jgi:hypothetical protein
LRFDEATVRAEQIKSLDEYVGARITIISFLGTARIPIQIDIGVGDAVVPSAEEVIYPTLLDHPAPRLKAYRMETVIAEKFHAMVVHGIMNTRLKDYFDVYYLSRNFNFDSRPIVEAIRATFERRGSNIPLGLPVGLTTKFSDDLRKIQQWEAFLRRVFVWPMTLSLSDVVEKIAIFVTPLLDVEGEHRLTWMAPGPWRTSDPTTTSQRRSGGT